MLVFLFLLRAGSRSGGRPRLGLGFGGGSRGGSRARLRSRRRSGSRPGARSRSRARLASRARSRPRSRSRARSRPGARLASRTRSRARSRSGSRLASRTRSGSGSASPLAAARALALNRNPHVSAVERVGELRVVQLLDRSVQVVLRRELNNTLPRPAVHVSERHLATSSAEVLDVLPGGRAGQTRDLGSEAGSGGRASASASRAASVSPISSVSSVPAVPVSSTLSGHLHPQPRSVEPVAVPAVPGILGVSPVSELHEGELGRVSSSRNVDGNDLAVLKETQKKVKHTRGKQRKQQQGAEAGS